jgi:glycosyltransferase involved in cell wall biosynthesis
MTAADGREVLYISYDGMTDPLGRSQVLPYLAGLAARGHRITILSCEKPQEEKQRAEVARICREAGVDWRPIAYHKRPPVLSSIYDAAMLLRRARSLHRERGFDILHCRSYIPALVGLALKRRFGIRFLFDMRGFWADEKAEGGSWRIGHPVFGRVYRFFKGKEAKFLAKADHVVSLTRNARTEIRQHMLPPESGQKISVIPCCVDFDHFALVSPDLRKAGRAALGIDPDRPVLAYLGSLGGNYMLDEMLLFFRAYKARRPGALFLFVTRDDAAMIRAAAAAKAIGSEDVLIVPATRDQVPLFLSAADAGVAFKQPSFSAKACSPTKMGEMLAVGIPIAVNAGVGDVEAVVADTGAGVVVDRFDEEAIGRAADALLAIGGDRAAIRAGARRWFDLASGVEEYDSIYRSLPRPDR